MKPDPNIIPADQELLEQLEDLVNRARARGIRTGIRNDEIQDLDQAQAVELVDQLRRRLGEDIA